MHLHSAHNQIVPEYGRKASAYLVTELIPLTMSSRAEAIFMKGVQNVCVAARLAVAGTVCISSLKTQATPYDRATIFYCPKPYLASRTDCFVA